jgi:hypothetical protein
MPTLTLTTRPRSGETYRAFLQRWSEALTDRKPFTSAGAMHGTDFPTSTGRLPADWTRTFHARRNFIDYAVMSYETPIAWHDTEAGWVVPAVTYSVTTTRHQAIVRSATLDYPYDD